MRRKCAEPTGSDSIPPPAQEMPSEVNNNLTLSGVNRWDSLILISLHQGRKSLDETDMRELQYHQHTDTLLQLKNMNTANAVPSQGIQSRAEAAGSGGCADLGAGEPPCRSVTNLQLQLLAESHSTSQHIDMPQVPHVVLLVLLPEHKLENNQKSSSGPTQGGDRAVPKQCPPPCKYQNNAMHAEHMGCSTEQCSVFPGRLYSLLSCKVHVLGPFNTKGHLLASNQTSPGTILVYTSLCRQLALV
ncbi:hypothetical protein Anapl_14871 [Anas platyrhynchos]|uniref:Uncharacterized protein n=1 Tax=Anas platyrhynchos TaxID=8839 RepID=R0KCE5_ANAPL|nr:hypothetical protein Anapl_14871 [Anas platyrhynchos]